MKRLYSSFVYFDRCRHFEPYRSTKAGMGAIARPIAPNSVNAQPQPTLSTMGFVISGRNVLNKHLATMTAVTADAEYNPKASTTYAISGRKLSSIVVPSKPTDKRRSQTGRRFSAIQPYEAMTSGKVNAPMIIRGRRYSGLPKASGESRRSLM